ncbi:sigma-70 family RNA polymerase sigma factor [Pedobacter paludis]|uniref:RNA polymerase sigma-70 factor n=1 Tax=Pedobacter paludis TaxID=2203212 RepID=A0A317F739_9SPHI|nr:sigma-70 family RNA polymerase sigma factor [Pedobacter paludis]PWS33338.1 RNA polymerase sigma-70 factor [Pedobacter paludis]
MMTSGKELPNEMELFQRFAQGDMVAFKKIYDQYNPPLSSFIQKMVKSLDLTQEVVQYVWVVVWNDRTKLENVANPAGYLHRLARYKTYNYLKKIALDRDLMQKMARVSTELHNELEEMFDLKHQEALIKDAVQELSPQRKKIWEMSRTQHLSHEEIAEALQISKSTVNNQIVAASAQIKSFLENNGTLLSLATLFSLFKDY